MRAELDAYPDLAPIRIIGPEDLLGGNAYGMWEYGGPIHKNLQYLEHIGDDPRRSQATGWRASVAARARRISSLRMGSNNH